MANVAPVFTSFRVFRSKAYEVYIHLPKCAQYNIGDRFMNTVCDCLVLLRQWEWLYNTQFKLDAIVETQRKFIIISDLIEFMVDERMVSLKQCAHIIAAKEEVERQLGGIRKALERSLQSSACQM